MTAMQGATVTLTGGTGSFGSTMVSHLLTRGVDKVHILSRDEAKQDEMRRRSSSSRLRFFLGDVRDFDSVAESFVNTDFVFHAAALKQVPSCMAASRPILAHAAGDVADLITASQSGVAVQPGDVTAAVEAIRCLSEMSTDKLLEMGGRARVHYEMNFAPNVGLDRLESWLIGKDPRISQQTNQ